MKNLIPYYNKNMLKIIDFSKAIISNYGHLNELSQEKISCDNYEIIGSDLKIVRMDDYEIEIMGKMEKIFFIEK